MTLLTPVWVIVGEVSLVLKFEEKEWRERVLKFSFQGIDTGFAKEREALDSVSYANPRKTLMQCRDTKAVEQLSWWVTCMVHTIPSSSFQVAYTRKRITPSIFCLVSTSPLKFVNFFFTSSMSVLHCWLGWELTPLLYRTETLLKNALADLVFWRSRLVGSWNNFRRIPWTMVFWISSSNSFRCKQVCQRQLKLK